MEPITVIAGAVSVLDRNDVDTDQIMPKQFLKRVERTGFGEYVFHDWARQPGWDLPRRPILVTGRNFGCGSSREHAVWAIENYGFRVVIAPSFADIFYNNCFKNGVLPIRLSEEQVEDLFQRAAKGGCRLTVDLNACRITDQQGLALPFTVEEARRHNLLHGLDDIALTLQHEAKIAAYERSRATAV